MSKVCQLTGKRRSIGNKISHSNRKTKRTFAPNLIMKTILEPSTGIKIRVKMSTRAQRTLLKNPSKFKVELAKIAKKKLKKMAIKK